MSFDADLETVQSMLRRRGRASLRAIALELGVDDDYVLVLRDELVDVLRIATEDGGVLELRDTAGTPAPEPEPAPRTAERRQVTFLFCDVVGSTPLSARLDPEDLREVMLAYQRACGEAIARHDGHVSQWIGDGVVVYFGYPDAHDDDAVRAIRAGLDIVDAVRALGLEAAGEPISVRIGVHTGPAVVGDVGDTGRQETLAFGETPNLCARIEAAADPNSVFVSERTLGLVAGFFEVEDRGPHELKGATAPMRLYRVLGEAGARTRFDVVRQQGLAPLVDRTGEREQLAAAWRRATAGEPQAILLEGEAGIGKSRLAHHCRETLPEGGACIEIQGAVHRRASALYPVGEALRAHWGLDDLADDDARLDAVAAAVARCPSLDADVVSFLADLVGVPAPPPPPRDDMTPQRQRAMTLAAIVELVCEEARRRPLLVVVEDVHWLDASTQELLGMLLDRRDGGQLLVLLTTRPRDELPGLQAATRVALGPLAPGDAAELAAATIGDAAPDVVARVAANADGVPLFVEELARSLARDDPGAGIPESLQSCLQARLDRLSPPARQLAQWAAACGRQFDAGLLADATGLAPAALERSLDELERERLVSRAGAGYEFRHALIQEAAARSVLRSDARKQHDAIATALQHRGEAPEVVARHLREAGRVEEAIDAFQQAGMAALGASAIAEATAHFDEALALVAALPESRDRDEREVALQVARAVPLTLSRGWASVEVGEAYRRADELCSRIGETPQLFPTLVGLATFDIVRAAHDEARQRARRHLAIAERAGDPELLVEAEHDAGTTAFYSGDLEEAMAHLDRTVELFDPVAHQHHVLLYGKNPAAIAHEHAGLASWLLGRPDEAVARHEAAFAVLDGFPHPFTRLWVATGLTVVRQMRGEVDEAGRAASEVVAEASVQGFPNWLAQALVYDGWARARAGDADAGLAEIAQGIELWQMTGAALLVPYLLWCQADALRAAGRDAEASDRLAEATDLATKTNERWWLPELLRASAELDHAAGHVDEAAALLDRAVELAEAGGMWSLVLRACTTRAELFGGEDARRAVADALGRIVGGAETADVRRAAALVAPS